MAFVGDTLFAIGCGRVIEGDVQMMWQSLKKLMALPKDTAVYCGHEYTQSNAKFALTIEPENEALQKRAKEVDQLRAAGKPTLPTHHRHRAGDQPVPAPARGRLSRSGSAWRASQSGRSSARSASARTAAELGSGL